MSSYTERRADISPTLTLDTVGPVFEGGVMKFKDIIEFEDDDHRRLTARMRQGWGVDRADGDTLSTQELRAFPCPAKIRAGVGQNLHFKPNMVAGYTPL